MDPNPFDQVLGDWERSKLLDASLLEDQALGWVVGVRLMFEGGDVYLTVVPEDDTVSVSLEEPKWFYGQARWVKDSTLWREAVGMRVKWYWRMCNNQGYWDGFQIEFVGTGKECVCVQVVAVASRLTTRRVG